MNEGLRTIIRINQLQIETCIYYSKYSLKKNQYENCKKWLKLGWSNIKFLEYYMNKKPDYNPFVWFDDISFNIDKDTRTKILQKYPNT